MKTRLVQSMVNLATFKAWRKPRNTTKRLHCMVDLETLSTESNAYIRSVGAVFFSSAGLSGSGFYDSCDGFEQPGADINPATEAWWDKQTSGARDALANTRGTRLQGTLAKLARWMGEYRVSHSPDLPRGRRLDPPAPADRPEVWVWGNGADFDCVILANAFKRCGMEVPWKYYNVRCYRTLSNVFRREVPKPKFDGEKHHALADAVNQARHAAAIFRHIGLD